MNQLLPPALVARLLVFPAQMEANALHVCMLNPTDGWTVRALEAVSGCRVFPMVAHEAAVIAALTQHYASVPAGRGVSATSPRAARPRAEAAYRELLDAPFQDYAEPAISLVNRNRDLLIRGDSVLLELIRDPVIIRLVQQMLCRAVETGASDLHVEPAEHELRVRARIDGSLRVLRSLSAVDGAADHGAPEGDGGSADRPAPPSRSTRTSATTWCGAAPSTCASRWCPR